MENKIILDLELFKIILDQEAKKLTGKTMKRFELPFTDNDKKSLTKEEILELKKQIKELQYEFFRDLYDILKTGKVILDFTKCKEGEQNGK